MVMLSRVMMSWGVIWMARVRVSTTRMRSIPNGKSRLNPGEASAFFARPNRKTTPRSYSCRILVPVRSSITPAATAAPNTMVKMRQIYHPARPGGGSAGKAARPDVTKGASWPKVVAQMHSLIGLFHKIYNVPGLIQIGGLAAMAAVVFAETGLLVGFFLPGDSLLVTAGVFCTSATPGEAPLLNIVTLNLAVIAAAIVGDTVGYWI